MNTTSNPPIIEVVYSKLVFFFCKEVVLLKKWCKPNTAIIGKTNSMITCIEDTALNLLYSGT